MMCVFLLFQRDGILSLLDEESHFPQSNDSSLVQKLNKYCKDSTRYAATMGNRVAFSVRHYAEQVRKCSFLFPFFLSIIDVIFFYQGFWNFNIGPAKIHVYELHMLNRDMIIHEFNLILDMDNIPYMYHLWIFTYISVKINISTKNVFKSIAKELITK